MTPDTPDLGADVDSAGGLPPPYSDVAAAHRARAELRQNFITLTSDQRDIQELFRTVAGQLEATPEIGEEHPLVEEWNTLRQVRVFAGHLAGSLGLGRTDGPVGCGRAL